MVVQWLKLHTSSVGGMGSTPGWKTKIPHAVSTAKKKKKKKKGGSEKPQQRDS